MNQELVKESLHLLGQSLSLASRHLGRVVRVRRRGFARDVRRGDDIQWSASTDRRARVLRRSRHFLWLEIDRPSRELVEGTTVTVRLPKRLQ